MSLKTGLPAAAEPQGWGPGLWPGLCWGPCSLRQWCCPQGLEGGWCPAAVLPLDGANKSLQEGHAEAGTEVGGWVSLTCSQHEGHWHSLHVGWDGACLQRSPGSATLGCGSLLALSCPQRAPATGQQLRAGEGPQGVFHLLDACAMFSCVLNVPKSAAPSEVLSTVQVLLIHH